MIEMTITTPDGAQHTLPSKDLQDANQLPAVCGVYIVTGFAEMREYSWRYPTKEEFEKAFAESQEVKTLYVGSAKNLNTRWKAHHRVLDLMTFTDVVIHWTTCEPEERLKLERSLITSLKPVLNGKRKSLVKESGYLYRDDPPQSTAVPIAHDEDYYPHDYGRVLISKDLGKMPLSKESWKVFNCLCDCMEFGTVYASLKKISLGSGVPYCRVSETLKMLKDKNLISSSTSCWYWINPRYAMKIRDDQLSAEAIEQRYDSWERHLASEARYKESEKARAETKNVRVMQAQTVGAGA